MKLGELLQALHPRSTPAPVCNRPQSLMGVRLALALQALQAFFMYAWGENKIREKSFRALGNISCDIIARAREAKSVPTLAYFSINWKSKKCIFVGR